MKHLSIALLLLGLTQTGFTNFARAEATNEQVQMSINFFAETCWQGDHSMSCSMNIGKDTVKTIQLNPRFEQCEPGTGSTPWPWSDDPVNGPAPCQPTMWRGHWIDLLYNGGQRYLGIVTVEKSLISLSAKPGEMRTWFSISVEILDMKKTVAKMTTSFEDFSQLGNAVLEGQPIEVNNSTTKIKLSIGKALPSVVGSAMASPTKATWQVSAGKMLIAR